MAKSAESSMHINAKYTEKTSLLDTRPLRCKLSKSFCVKGL